jgi:D-lactate dehydrogenase
MLASKGMAEAAEDMSNRLEAALMKASTTGHPVVMDASACSARMQKHLTPPDGLRLHEFATMRAAAPG